MSLKVKRVETSDDRGERERVISSLVKE